MSDADQAALPDEDAVVRFLSSQPDFFTHHPELLNELELPAGTGASSLHLRQVTQLREKLAAKSEEYELLKDVATSNDKVQRQLYKLAVNIILSEDIPTALHKLEHVLKEEFEIEHSAIRFYTDTEHALDGVDEKYIEQTEQSRIAMDAISPKLQPVCNVLTRYQLASLFGFEANQLKSHIFIPIRRKGLEGYIALASTDENRWTTDMNTDFLFTTAGVLSAALYRLIANG